MKWFIKYTVYRNLLISNWQAIRSYIACVRHKKDMIDIQNLSYRYPGTHRNVFSDFSLSLSDGRVYGLLGKNGTGKSTLLYLISGLLRPGKGSEVSVDGMRSFDRDPEMLRDIFLVSEEDLLPGISLKSYRNILRRFYPHFYDAILHECLSEFGLPDDIRNLHALSMGQRKKVTMSVALASGCRLLLLDEPTNGLDIPSKTLFRKVVAKYMSDDRTMIISTHQVHDIESLLDHIIIMDQSRVLLDSSVGDIMDKYAFRFISADAARSPEVLYTEPSPMGLAAIMYRKPDEEETNLNLELLFDYILIGKEK